MFNYTCLNPIAGVGLDLLSDEYNKVEDIKDAQAVLVRSAAMHDMELPKTLEVVARAGAGVNNIPLDKCAEKGVVVFNTPGANANGVKELVVAGLLLASRDLMGGYNWVKDNASDENLAKAVEKQKKQYAGNEIAGKKLGVIGLGAIGAKVANIAVRLGMEVYGYDPFVSVDAAWGLSKYIKHITNVEDIYKECDYITIHVPALPATKGMLNADAFAMMKDGVRILNFARDVLVNDEDIKAALASGKVAKYVTDFPNPAIAGTENVIALPHLGASTEESEDNCAIMACKEITDFMELTSKQRAQLRGLANDIDTIVQVGKDGIGDNLVKQVSDALEARELIKGRVLENSMLTAREAAEQLAVAARCEVVQVIGKKIVLYKPDKDKPKIELPR